MTDDPKKVVKVKVNDKRRGREVSAGAPEGDVPTGSPLRSASEGDAHAASSPVRPTESSPSSARSDIRSAPSSTRPNEGTREENEFLEDLRRVQADFENFRKRVMRDQANVAARASAALVESLLPVLDNFERAISHGEGGEGVELVFKELKATLEREGLEEIAAEGAEFDPNRHEAVESREQEGLEAPTVIEVLRRGYLFKGQLLRAAMVIVGRPPENEIEATER